jgi:hypothetical protein
MVLLAYLFRTRSLLGFRTMQNHAAAIRFVSVSLHILFCNDCRSRITTLQIVTSLNACS